MRGWTGWCPSANVETACSFPQLFPAVPDTGARAGFLRQEKWWWEFTRSYLVEDRGGTPARPLLGFRCLTTEEGQGRGSWLGKKNLEGWKIFIPTICLSLSNVDQFKHIVDFNFLISRYTKEGVMIIAVSGSLMHNFPGWARSVLPASISICFPLSF